MAYSEEEVLEIFQKIADEAHLNKKIRAVVHREDYADYVVVLGVIHYCEIREKLFNDYMQSKHRDFKNQIIFRFKHPTELDEFMQAEFGITQEEIDAELLAERAQKDGKGYSDSTKSDKEDEKKKIAVDDSDKFDWI